MIGLQVRGPSMSLIRRGDKHDTGSERSSTDPGAPTAPSHRRSKPRMTFDVRSILDAVLRDYALDRGGIHGVAHWARVTENGLRLAGETGADVEVVRLFALLHDSRRISDGIDPEHGPRAAEFAGTLKGRMFKLIQDQSATPPCGLRGPHTRADASGQHGPDLLGRRSARPAPDRHHAAAEVPLHRNRQAGRDDPVGPRAGSVQAGPGVRPQGLADQSRDCAMTLFPTTPLKLDADDRSVHRAIEPPPSRSHQVKPASLRRIVGAP